MVRSSSPADILVSLTYLEIEHSAEKKKGVRDFSKSISAKETQAVTGEIRTRFFS